MADLTPSTDRLDASRASLGCTPAPELSGLVKLVRGDRSHAARREKVGGLPAAEIANDELESRAALPVNVRGRTFWQPARERIARSVSSRLVM